MHYAEMFAIERVLRYAKSERRPPFPDTPTPPGWFRSHELRQHLLVNPERVPCSGFIFMASANRSTR